MSYAQQLLDEGLAEGKRQVKVEVIEGLLRMGMTWDLIQQATGLNESQFQALKQQVRPFKTLRAPHAKAVLP